MTPAVNYSLTDCEEWLALNTNYCKRLRSRLTAEECEKQQQYSQGHKGDLRCSGCGGPDNQPEVFDDFGEYGKARPILQLVRPVIVEVPEPLIAVNAESGEDFATQISEQVKAESFFNLDFLNAVDDREAIRDLSDITSLMGGDDELARELQSILLEMDELEEIEIDLPEPTDEVRKPSNKPRRYAVYQGRCKRCGGYMDNTREMQNELVDEDVQRCLSCG